MTLLPHVEENIAIPSVFIVGRDGRIAWKYVGETMADRAEEDEVIRAAERAAGKTAR